MRPSDRLEKYDLVLTIKTSIGYVPLYKMIEKFFFIEAAKELKMMKVIRLDSF